MNSKQQLLDPDRFRELVEHTSDWLWEIDTQTHFTYASPKVKELLGYEPEELIGTSAFDLMPDEEAERVKVEYLKRVSERQPFHGMININQHKDGRLITLESNGVALFDDSGKWIGYRGIDRDITQQHESINKLKETKDLLELIFENTHTLIAYMDTEFNFIRVNQSYLQADNRTADELIGNNHFDFYPNDENKKIFQQVVDSGEPHFAYSKPFEYGHSPERGITHWDWSLFPIKENNTVIALLLVLVDVTRRVNAQEALLRNEDSLNSAQAISHFGSWDWNILTGDLHWTDEIYRIFGLQPQAFSPTYDAFLQTIHPDDRHSVIDAVNKCVENSNSRYDLQHRIIRPDNEIRHVHEKGEVYRDENGRAIRMLGVVQDITDRLKAEEALRISEERYELAVRGTNDGIWDWNIISGDDYFSPRFRELLGYDEDDEFPQRIESFTSRLHPDDTKRVSEAITNHLENNTPYNIELRLRKKNDDYIWFLSRGQAIWDANGNAVRMSGSVTDITERKLAEDRILELNNKLQQRVSEREKELEKSLKLLEKENLERKNAEAAMRAAKEEAESANKLKSEFLSRMSHELRTPMNAILGFTQLLNEESPNSIQSRFISEIMLAGKHLMGLINEVLNLSKIEAGTLDINSNVIPITEIIQESLQLIQSASLEKNISIDNLTENTDQSVIADKLRLKEVLINVLSNAIKYNHPGGNIIISTSPVTNGNMLQIKIADTGKGIAKEHQSLIFEPFNRLGQEYSDIEGTGIGLTIARKLITMMGGKINVESILNKGSTFIIELPLAQLQNEIVNDQRENNSHASPGGQIKTILYIEDNPANLRLVSSIIEKSPQWKLFSSTTAENGIELARKNRPDLVIMDLNLPGMDGYTALSRLRDYPETRDISVFALSASAMPRDIERGLLAGFKRYITKPIQVSDLREAITEELSKTGKNTI